MNKSSPLSSNAEKPTLRVSRPVAACSRCRRAKIKVECDGKLPACSACEKSGHAKSCASPNDKSSNGNERSYVACLESYIEELEGKIAFAIARKASSALQDVCEPVKVSDRSDSFAAIRAAVYGKAARRREAADVNELVSDFGFLSVNATTQDFEKTATGMTFGRLILAATINEPLPEYQSFRLPSKAVTMALATYYNDRILSLYPIFSEMVLLNLIDDMYQENAKSVTDFEYWIFCMVLAISSSSKSRSSNDKLYKEGVIWVGRALRFADRVLVPGYVSQIQALTLLVQYSMLDPAHFDSWNLVGFACRALVDLGFHQDPPKEEQTDEKTLELRRTIFYCVYSLDRSISMVHARSFSFTDDSTSVAFPSVRTKISPVSSQLSPIVQKSSQISLLLFKFRKIQSAWYQELFQSNRSPLASSSKYIWQTCQGMREWEESLPNTLPASTKELFNIELSYSFVYCLAPSSRVKAVSYGKILTFEHSIKYIQKMMAICQNSTDSFFYTYHDALRVFFVGSQFVSVIAENQDHLLSSVTSFVQPYEESLLSLIPSFVTESENIDRCLHCIYQIKETLKTFSHRWEDCKVLLSSFETQVNDLEESLQQRKFAISTVPKN